MDSNIIHDFLRFIYNYGAAKFIVDVSTRTDTFRYIDLFVHIVPSPHEPLLQLIRRLQLPRLYSLRMLLILTIKIT
jgi:hypothetical protein